MVFLSSNTGAKNHGLPQSSPDALHLWKKFKNISKQKDPNLVQDEEKKKSASSRRLTNTNGDFNSSSGSSLTTSKRSITQERLFSLQCRSQRKKAVQNSSYSTDSSSGSERKRSYLKSNNDRFNYMSREESVNMNGVLHLQKPLLTNSDNHRLYYEDRGRMPPIDWKNITSISQDHKPEKIEKAEAKKETVKAIAKSKPQISDELANFVENSVSPLTAYNKEGNIVRDIIASESPIFKIQQRISKKPLGTIQIPALVKSSFFKASSDSHLLNKIDTFRAVDPMALGNFKSRKIEGQDEQRNQAEQHKETNNHLINSALDQTESTHQDFEVNKEKQTQDCRPTHTCDDYDRITFIDTLTDEESAAKRESRKKEMEYNDDLFTFVQNPPESSSSRIEVSVPAPSEKKRNSYGFPFDRIQAVCKAKKFPFDRIKAVCKAKKATKTLDSDDTMNVSSDLESLSNRTVSMHASFEALKKKMNKLTSSRNNDTSDESPVLPDDDKVLENKNKLLNRCIRASHDYSKVPENNVVEITEVKVGMKSELLITPISTRYFAKDSTNAEELNDVNVTENVPIVSVCQEEKSNGNVNDYFSTVSIENELHRKDRQVDSGLCQESTDDSSVVQDSSETTLESKTDIEKHCFTLENTEKFDSKSDTMKIEKISSDSKNEEMDCKDFIDYDAFDVENVEMFFPGLTVENLKKQATSRMLGENNGGSLESGFDISNNNNILSCSTSESSNLNSDSDNTPSPKSQFNFNSNIFENVNIEMSALRTDGFAYNQTQEYENNCVELHPTSKIDNNMKNQSSIQIHAGKTNSEQNFINNNNVTLHNQEKSKPRNENVAVIPSKKLQKYQSRLKNFKKKVKPEADTRKEDKALEQFDNSSQFTTVDKKPLQRPILKEIQKLNLTFKKPV